MTKSTEQELNNCRDELVKRGVKDVKFYFTNLSEKPLSHLADDTVKVMKAILGGNYSKMPPLGDSQNK